MIGELLDHLVEGLWLSLATALPIVSVALVCGLAASFALSTLALQDEGATRLLRMIAALAGALWIAPTATAPLLEHATGSFANAGHAGAAVPGAGDTTTPGAAATISPASSTRLASASAAALSAEVVNADGLRSQASTSSLGDGDGGGTAEGPENRSMD